MGNFSRTMKAYWRSLFVLVTTFMISLATSGCAQYLNAISPQAHVSMTPSVYCPGEAMSIAWDGGPQIPDCVTVPPSDLPASMTDYYDVSFASSCKIGHWWYIPTGGEAAVAHEWWPYIDRGISRTGGIGTTEENLIGSAERVAPQELPFPGHEGNVTATFMVQWLEWARWSNRYRTEIRPAADAGPAIHSYITGSVRDRAMSTPYRGGGVAVPIPVATCESNQLTIQWDNEMFFRNRPINPEGVPWYVATPGYGNGWRGSLSACVPMAEICTIEIEEEDGTTSLIERNLSVPGGPNVTIGGVRPDGTSNPRCTAAFRGYSIYDVKLSSVGSYEEGGSCSGSWRRQLPSAVVIRLVGSTMCPGFRSPEGLEAAYGWQGGAEQPGEEGGVAMRGPSLDRCLDALRE